MANSPPSTEHSKWSTPEPLSEPENATVMEVDEVLPLAVTVFLFPSIAEVIEVFGSIVSIVHINEAGDGSLLSTLSVDLISIVWAPSVN
jgi:hypothetical protein